MEKVTFEHTFGEGKGGSLWTSGAGHSRQGAARWEEEPGLRLEQSEPGERSGGQGWEGTMGADAGGHGEDSGSSLNEPGAAQGSRQAGADVGLCPRCWAQTAGERVAAGG